jgi:hypothetical protein
MTTYLQHIPSELLGYISRGECLPVIGAGFSRNAMLPKGCFMPLWQDLGSEVAKRLGRAPCIDPKEDLSEYCDKFTKFELIRNLRDWLHIRSAKPGPAHLGFAKLPFPQILTTNFDFLLERAYEASGKTCLPVVDEDLLPFGLPDGETRIIKMHGDLHHPSNLVLTEDDYDTFASQHQEMAFTVYNLLVAHTPLFVGYSIDDPDLRQIWGLVKSHFGKFRRPAYALVVAASDRLVDGYRRRGVTKVVSLPGKTKDYGTILSALFAELSVAVQRPVCRR